MLWEQSAWFSRRPVRLGTAPALLPRCPLLCCFGSLNTLWSAAPLDSCTGALCWDSLLRLLLRVKCAQVLRRQAPFFPEISPGIPLPSELGTFLTHHSECFQKSACLNAGQTYKCQQVRCEGFSHQARLRITTIALKRPVCPCPATQVTTSLASVFLLPLLFFIILPNLLGSANSLSFSFACFSTVSKCGLAARVLLDVFVFTRPFSAGACVWLFAAVMRSFHCCVNSPLLCDPLVGFSWISVLLFPLCPIFIPTHNFKLPQGRDCVYLAHCYVPVSST